MINSDAQVDCWWTTFCCCRCVQRHGIINAVAWGFLLPVGVMAARYLRPICGANNPLWFYVHVTCQCTGYILGVAGWGLGMKLQSYNKGAIFYKHRNLGIAIFAFATFQVSQITKPPDRVILKAMNGDNPPLLTDESVENNRFKIKTSGIQHIILEKIIEYSSKTARCQRNWLDLETLGS